MKKTNKIITVVILVLLLFSSFQNIILGVTEITKANLTIIQNISSQIQFKFSSGWTNVRTNYIGYNENGNTYPAYCISHGLPGVDELGDYTVSIEKTLEDVRVWRTIINGFPYKTAKELGVENNYDAYVATKQAIYCVILDRDVYSLYRGRTNRGDKIVDAINKLTEIGRNGTQTPQNAQLTLEQSGNLYEEGNFYVQKYKVSSVVDISSYTITNKNIPSGAIITNKSGIETTTFSGNESCYLKIPKSIFSTDINASITIQGKCKTYPVFYGKTSINGAQDYAVTFNPYGNELAKTNSNIKTNTGKVEIKKIDSETQVGLKGVVFQLLKEDGTQVATATTDSNGVATFTNLYQNNYKLREISTLDAYILNSEEIDISVEYNKTISKTITNEYKKGHLKINKVDSETLQPVQDVTFQLIDSNNKIVRTGTTNIKGELIFNNIRVGKYKLKETKTNVNYVLNNAVLDIDIEWNKTKNITIENELKKGQIRVRKVDLDNNEIRLKGVEFNVLDETGNIVDTLITDENGEAISKLLRANKKYTLQETKTLENYVLNEETKVVTLQPAEITSVTFENEKIKGYIQVTKTSAEDNKYSELPKGSPLPDVKFEVYDAEDNLVDTITTDKDGKAITKELLKGCYKIKEISSAKYYLLNTNIYDAEIVKDQEIVNVDITNDNVEIDIEIQKNGFIETQSKDDIFYNFKNIKNKSNVPLDNFIWSDHLPTDAVHINRLYTGTWNEDLKYDVYYKTNKTDKFVLFKEDLSTQIIYELNFKQLKLAEDEYVTDYEFRFGKVKKGFQEIDSPILYCDILEGLGNGYIFINKTKVKGNYFEKEVEDNDEWKTITYFKEIKIEEVLPRTRLLEC